ncbi:MAG: PQQ-binding-like beta-propeller repeat protein [Pseudomonadota bacterium]
MITRKLTVWLSLAFAAALAACGTTEDDRQREQFADAEPVLTLAEEILADPILAAEPLVVPPALVNDGWRQVGGEADHVLVHVAAPQAVERKWRTRIISKKAKKVELTAPPVTDETSLYVIDSVGSVAAFDVTNGRERWRTNLAPDVRDPRASRYNIFARVHPADLGFGGGAAVDGNSLFVTSGFGFVAALDKTTGEQIWKYEAPGPMRNPPLVAEGLVIAVSISNEVVAIDQNTGEERWTYESFEEAARFLAAAAPAYADDTVIVPFSSGEVAALSVANGRVQWQAVISRTSRLNALSVLGDIAGSPLVDRGAVFSVSQSGQMAGIDVRTGTVAWEAPVGGFHTPWLAGDALFVVSNRGDLTALNRIDGRVRWNATLPEYRNEKKRKDRITWAGPVLAGGRLWLAGSEGQMIAVSLQNGDVLERYKLKGDVHLPPIVSQNTVYVVTADGFVEAWGEAAVLEEYEN